jgi:large subunit ribosomal protein L22
MGKNKKKLMPANDQRSKAIHRHARISAFKARRAADLIRNKKVYDAFNILQYTSNKGCDLLEKVLKSAVANAEHNHRMDKEKLFVETCIINEAPTWKRILPRAQGRASRLKKRNSHITIILAEYNDAKAVKKSTKTVNKTETKEA